MPKKCYRRNCYILLLKKMALQNFFIIFLLIVHVWRKSMQEKRLGSLCLFLKYEMQKAILKASCYVSVAIATDSVVLKITEFKSRNINLSLVTSICQMKFKYAKSECQTAGNPNFKNYIEPPSLEFILWQCTDNVEIMRMRQIDNHVTSCELYF